MIQLILVLALIFFTVKAFSAIVNKIREYSVAILGMAVMVAVIVAGIVLAIKFPKVTSGLTVFCFAFGAVSKVSYKRSIKKWIEEKTPRLTEYQVDEILSPVAISLLDSDGNKADYKFDRDNIPYGRVNAFLNYFEKSIDTEEIYYFSPICSKSSAEIREYGIAVTRSGIYISKQANDSNLQGTDIVIPFTGLWKTEVEKSNLNITHIDSQKATATKTEIDQYLTTVPIDKIKELCDKVSTSKISNALSQGFVLQDQDTQEEYLDRVNKSEQEFNRNQKTSNAGKISTVSGVMVANESFQTQYSETKNFMNGIRGNGYAAEYGNATIDRLKGRDVVNAAQHLDEAGRQVKNGADRIVDGQSIQTKYYKTAPESIGSAFSNKQALYLNGDGTMMAIEVPRDQYSKALKVMQKRIDLGQVPGAKPGDDPSQYVKKGFFTYAQSFNIAKAGTIEGLAVDTLNGAICSVAAGGVSATIAFGMAIWNGQNIKDAARTSIGTGIKVLGKGVMIYTLTMQLSRQQIANPLVKEFTKDGKYKGFVGIDNPVFKLGESIASSINKSEVAKTTLGKKMGLDSMTGKRVISGGVMTVVVFGPDICRALRGRISTEQLFKNSTVAAAGIGGSIVGQALIPIPIVGSAVGGMIGGFISKKALDAFIEDDAKKMFQILKEEFLDVVTLSNLSKEEFDDVVNMTLCNPALASILKDMYASNEYRRFAREALVSTAVVNVLAKRERITDDMIDAGYEAVLTEVVA